MSDNQTNPLPTWFWGVSIIMLLWNLMGVAAFTSSMTMSPEAIAALPEKDQAYIIATPLWANIAFGIAVIGGALGCVGLLLRKSWALPVLIISLVAVLLQMFEAFFLNTAVTNFSTSRLAMPLTVIIIAGALVWFANMAKGKSWLV